ncbi:MAG TPA: protein kinase, partial [Actinomycetota bacterium]|nr:protein kinase [Actinomycetota bacterium]
MVEASPLIGRYRLEERIAGGGMGTVYVATDELLGRQVAAKLLNEELADNPSFVERFRREARSVAALVHPNIATVFDYGEDAGRHFIVMELVRGRDLDRVLADEGALAPERARHIATKVCDALGHAHGAGVIHRDVKPANVIVTQDEGVKVTDFGIARVADDAAMTASGTVLGTAQYISPEQASDHPVGPASDVYSMGIMLFEMLTGRRP